MNKTILLVFILQIFCAQVYSQISDAIATASLSGISAFNISVSNPDLQNGVEQKLHAAGIHTITGPIWVDSAGAAELYVRVDTLHTKSGQILYWISASVIEKVMLKDNPTRETLATTWSTSQMGIASGGNGGSTIRATTNECLNKLIASYSLARR